MLISCTDYIVPIGIGNTDFHSGFYHGKRGKHGNFATIRCFFYIPHHSSNFSLILKQTEKAKVLGYSTELQHDIQQEGNLNTVNLFQ